VRFYIFPIEVHIAQRAHCVMRSLIVEVRRVDMPALAAGSNGTRTHTVSELDNRDEAIPAGAVPLLCILVWPGAKRSE
jgi:hypothetical protein